MSLLGWLYFFKIWEAMGGCDHELSREEVPHQIVSLVVPRLCFCRLDGFNLCLHQICSYITLFVFRPFVGWLWCIPVNFPCQQLPIHPINFRFCHEKSIQRN